MFQIVGGFKTVKTKMRTNIEPTVLSLSRFYNRNDSRAIFLV